jgi:hypothetical protein
MFCYLIYFLFLEREWYLFDLIISYAMQSVDCVNCNFYIETDSYILCFIIKFEWITNCYDNELYSNDNKCLIRLQEWVDYIKSF